jgi:hypothetical protein
MARRPPVGLACLVFAAIGLLLGLTDFRRLTTYPLERFGEFAKLPQPLSILWIEELRRPSYFIEGGEGAIIALKVALLLSGFWLLAALLSPGFRLVKPPHENPGKHFSAHLEVPRLLRAAAAVLLSAWWMGLLSGVSVLLPREGRAGHPISILLAGLPGWTSGIPGIFGPITHALLLYVLLWLTWGPGGIVAPAGETRRSDVLKWGLLAGMTAFPAIFLLNAGRIWLASSRESISLADRAGWHSLLAITLAAPAVAMLYLAVHAYLCRPRPLAGRTLAGGVAGALLFMAGTGFAITRGHGLLNQLDVGKLSIGRALGLAPAGQQRIAVVLTPRGRALYTTSPDGSVEPTGGTIYCHQSTIDAVQNHLRSRKYRSQLALPGYIHLLDCASLDWRSTWSLELSMEQMERSPHPAVAQVLIERLSNCPITVENRRFLDRLADERQFRWTDEAGRRWLGGAFLRFGDSARARDYLLHANLSPQELQAAIGGIAPLIEGTVRGRLTIAGKAVEAVRVGLINVALFRSILGAARPFDWRAVLTATHTDAKGRFEFRNIPEGRYVLIVTGGGIGRYRGAPTAVPPPGMISLDRFHATRDLPAFDLRFVPVPGGPQGMPEQRPTPRAPQPSVPEGTTTI